ncbi:MAG: flagellar hook-basal body complex protein [Actinobacteria bacterium]|nr:flagellar hook-basal body complex protein [Actinomycetota bacterium]
MMQAMRSAASGMSMQQLAMDVTANNISNVSTPGFKGYAPRFTDLLYGSHRGPAGVVLVGMGAGVSEVRRDLASGAFENDGDPFHLAIEGEGFFQVRLPDGGVGYTRAGLLGVDGEGNLVVGAGMLLEPPLALPQGTSGFAVDERGLVTVTGADGKMIEVGRMVLARFVNPAGLEARGDGVLLATEASGPPLSALPGEGGAGFLRQGFLEYSNVDLAREMVEMITALRAYEMNAKMVQTADESLGVANNILRS